MARLAIFEALPALLAIIQTVSSTPLTFGGLHLRNESQPDDPVWPKTEEELSLGNAVLINLENFNYVRVEDDGTVVVGTGIRFGDLVNIIRAAGKELTVGSCPCVGATGAMLGGGLGRLQGLYGLTSDALRKVRMALWNGTIIEASDKVNQDLFWGIRGLGQNYGIVMESTFETWPATNGGMHYNADMIFTKDSVGRIMEITNNLTTPALDAALSFVIFFCVGCRNVQVLGFIPASCATGPRYNLYSAITRTLDPDSFVEFSYAFEKFMQNYPQANGSTMMVETFPVQGIEAFPDHYSAFPHRNHFRNMIKSIGSYTDNFVANVMDNFFRK
ncbi:hypothetical protein DL762_004841 [Monosporascus cannonballus]|uniref:FAD-binding PCMH-type domain-containing protein n=1 Tax=Monosporascus cannonballus TaxID=155416 RepID=A0ABY0HB34_9PEZI|nr:hypothetical protein DL762_004841 [Monosporascus cannonballus]RYO93017.1 hypothetical protein DL763_004517 [Monosporascus cannonballus]